MSSLPWPEIEDPILETDIEKNMENVKNIDLMVFEKDFCN